MTDERGSRPDNPIDPASNERAIAHVAEFVASDGREPEARAPMLLITTRGRKSGKWHRTAIFHATDGDALVVFGSNSAGATDPHWYLNLREDPEVYVQLPGEPIKRTSARVLGAGPERDHAWQLLLDVFPPYAEHVEKVEREIPIIRLEPAA